MVDDSLSKKDQMMQRIGLVLWILGVLVGGLLLVFFFGSVILGSRDPGGLFLAMVIGGFAAVVACFFYVWVPIIIDRYDPEPWWALLMAFLWGAIPACGFAAWINTINGEIAGAIGGAAAAEFVGAVISAPIVEEGFKALAVLGVFFFLHRQFDGIVDGVIYATFSALGFAMTENILYYGRAGAKGGVAALTGTFILRGILAPWGHPLYTSMTGIGFGLARELPGGFLKYAAPILGYFVAIGLHATWNGSAVLSDSLGFPLFFLMLPLWFLFLFAFGVIVILLVRREGQIIRKHLQDEVLLGNLTREEMELVCSPIGRIRALFSGGGLKGRRFVDAASRLALSKWHSARAMQGRKMTISADFIVPLRQELQKLRWEIQQQNGGKR